MEQWITSGRQVGETFETSGHKYMVTRRKEWAGKVRVFVMNEFGLESSQVFDMENNEPEYGEKSIYTADEFGKTPAAELNREYLEDSKDDTQMAMAIGGDEMHHRAADELRERLGGIVYEAWRARNA